MSALDGKRLLFVVTTAIVPSLVVAACAIQLRGDGENAATGSPASTAADPLAAKLEHCRTVTPEQLEDIQACRRVWAESHGRFLEQRKTPAAPSVNAQPSVPGLSSTKSKNPGHVLRERPPVATTKSE